MAACEVISRETAAATLTMSAATSATFPCVKTDQGRAVRPAAIAMLWAANTLLCGGGLRGGQRLVIIWLAGKLLDVLHIGQLVVFAHDKHGPLEKP